MLSILVTLGWIALILGIILLVVGYLAQARAIRPGWAALILGVILLLLGYLLPAADTSDTPHHDTVHTVTP